MKDLFYQRRYWQTFAEKEQRDNLSRDLHSSWSELSQSYEEVSEIPEEFLEEIRSNTPLSEALDFGVGMGRNYDYLNSIFSKVHGYDTEQMIGRLKEYKPEAKGLACSLDETFSRKYDLVYESVSMQHMPPQEVILYLSLISKHSRYFFSWTRSYNDFLRDFSSNTGGINLFTLIKSLDLFELVNCSIDVEEASREMDETHYKVLYKCKNFTENEGKLSINADGSINYS